MDNAVEVFQSSRQRSVGLRKRVDVTVAEHIYRNERFWLIKDPLEMEFYRLNTEEYAVWKMIDGKKSLDDIKEQFEAEFPPQRITHRQLQSFLSDLHNKSLLAYTDCDVAAQLIQRGKEKRLEKWKKNLSGILTLKWRGVDPDRFLDRLTPRVGWLFSLPAVICSVLFMVSAVVWLLVHLHLFLARLPALNDFLSQRNWLLLGAVIVTMKILHELGHGIAFKRLGGECHEIGVMLLMLIIPTLYCSTTDSWLLKSKWKRAAIGAAGMYVELFVAAVATYVWWFGQPGTLNMICLNIMATGSISVLVFNANPFLKYDGYYIFSDVMELPNLRERAGKQTQSWFFKYGLGIDEDAEPNSRLATKVTLTHYQLSAFVFRILIVVMVQFMLIDRLRPYGLGYFGLAVGLLALGALLVPPFWGLYKFFKIPGRLHRIEMKRAAVTWAMVSLIAAVVFGLPLPHHVTCPFTIETRDGQAIYVRHDAVLRNLNVRPGDRVEAGDVVAELENIETSLTLARLRTQGNEKRAELRLLQSNREASPKLAARIAELLETLATNEESAREYEEIVSAFHIVAERDGWVIPEWTGRRPEQGEQMNSWDGSPLDAENLGTRLTSGQKLCTIGDLHRFDAVLAVNEHDISFVEAGQTATLMLDSMPGFRTSYNILSVARKQSDELAGSLSKANGGTIQLQPATKSQSTGLRPSDEHFEALVSLTDSPLRLSDGLRGHARIRVGSRTLFQRFTLLVYRNFRKKL